MVTATVIKIRFKTGNHEWGVPGRGFSQQFTSCAFSCEEISYRSTGSYFYFFNSENNFDVSVM